MISWVGIEEKGFSGISRAFLNHYRELNITMEEALLTIHILDHAWLGQNPFPSTKWLCEKTGKSDQTIRMYLRSLCAKGFLIQIKDNRKANTYDWTPLMNSIRTVSKIPDAPESRDLQEVKSNNELQNLIDASLELTRDRSKGRVPVQTKSPHWKKLNTFVEKAPCDYNAHDMEFVLASAWKSKGWKTPPPRLTKKDLSHAKNLIEQYGSENTSNVIASIVNDWESVANQFNIKGYPSMPIFFGFRNSFFPMVIDGQLNSHPSWGSQFNKEDAPSSNKQIGW